MFRYPATLLIAGLFMFFLNSCTRMKPPELVAVENVKTPALGFKSSVVTMQLHFYNPNNARVRFKHARGEAWLEGKKLGRFSIDSSMTIPAKADFRLPLTLEMETSDALKNMALLLLRNEILLKIDGKARVGKSGIYINYPIRFEGKQPVSGLLK